MNKIWTMSRSRPVLMLRGRAHLGAAAEPVSTQRNPVTRAEMQALFSVELGYSRVPA